MTSDGTIHGKKTSDVAGMFFLNPYKIPKFGGKSKKLAGIISPDTSLFPCMLLWSAKKIKTSDYDLIWPETNFDTKFFYTKKIFH